QASQALLRVFQLPVRFRLGRLRFPDGGADVFGVRPECWRQDLREYPNQCDRDDRKVNPLESSDRTFSRLHALFSGKRRSRKTERSATHEERGKSDLTNVHRASRAGSKTREAISAASCATLGSRSRRAAASSAATRCLAAATSAADFMRASFNNAAPSSSDFLRSASCPA